jgi:hypothetical protein
MARHVGEQKLVTNLAGKPEEKEPLERPTRTEVIILKYIFFFYPAFTTLSSLSLMITHKDTPQSAGLLWTRDQPVAETST